MIRLKLFLAFTLTLLFAVTAKASDVSLNSVDVSSAANSTTLTLHASGAFAHKEQTPTASLINVYLPGVSHGKLSNELHAVKTPGMVGYRVLDWKDANGADSTMVEIAVAANTTAAFRELPNGLALKVEAKSVATGVSPVGASAASALPNGDHKPASDAVMVQNVAVTHTPDGVQVEITGSGALQQSSQKIGGPDRLVIDLQNSIPLKQNTIPVNTSEARDVRVAQFQAAPPVTRVVVDLGKDVQYHVAAQGNKVVVNLHANAQQASAVTKPQSTPAVTPQHSAKAAVASKPQVQTATAQAKPATAKPVQTASAQQQSAQPPASTGPAPAPAEPVQTASAPEKHELQPAQDFVAVNMQEKQPKGDSDPAPHSTDSPASHFADSQPLAPETKSLATPAMSAANLAKEQQQTMQAPKVGPRPKYTGAPYSFNLKDADLKDFFRAIAEITGLNIVLDPNVKGTLTLDVHDVPWDQALDIVLQNNNLDKQLNGNVLRIATVDTLTNEAKQQLEKEKAQALAVGITTYTHYLSYAHSKDVKDVVKKFLSARGDITSDDRTNAIIVRDIPSTIPEIQRLLIQLDRKTQQVEIEARVVAATRNFARDIGTQLGFGVGGTVNGVNASAGGTGAVGATPTTFNYGGSGTPAPYPIIGDITKAAIPLFSNLGVTNPTSGIGATLIGSNWRLDSVLTLAESRGLLKVLSRPRVVTQDNVKAIVKQGMRVPVVTQAQLGGPPTVTYVDAFLQLTVTPQITAEGTVFLNLEVENTTADFTREVQGNPTLVTQQEITQVLVTNGGTVQIGGVMLTNNNVNVFQVPLLGNIPILGNAFKRRQVSTSTQELIFFITPKIIET